MRPFSPPPGASSTIPSCCSHFYEIAQAPRCWRQQQVSSALHNFCPVLLRRITPQHPWIDSRTPLGVLAAHPSPWLSPLTHAEIALDSLTQAFHCSRRLRAFYLELAGDFWLPGRLRAMARSMVCFLWRSDDVCSTGAFGQLWIAGCCVLCSRLSQGQDRCPSLQFHTGGRGVRLPPGLPFGAQLLRALRGLYDLVGACRDARTAPCPCTAPALTVCCLRSRLAGCSSSPHRAATILGSLGISGAMCTHLPMHILRADASVGTESAR